MKGMRGPTINSTCDITFQATSFSSLGISFARFAGICQQVHIDGQYMHERGWCYCCDHTFNNRFECNQGESQFLQGRRQLISRFQMAHLWTSYSTILVLFPFYLLLRIKSATQDSQPTMIFQFGFMRSYIDHY